MYTVYIIKSKTTDRYYVGVTTDSVQRLRHHNSGANRSTKNKGRLLTKNVMIISAMLGLEKSKLKNIKAAKPL